VSIIFFTEYPAHLDLQLVHLALMAISILDNVICP